MRAGLGIFISVYHRPGEKANAFFPGLPAKSPCISSVWRRGPQAQKPLNAAPKAWYTLHKTTTRGGGAVTLRDKLFRWRDPYDLAGTEDLFAAAMAENAALQAAGCPDYRLSLIHI